MTFEYITHLKKMEYHARRLLKLMEQVNDEYYFDKIVMRSMLSDIKADIRECQEEIAEEIFSEDFEV